MTPLLPGPARSTAANVSAIPGTVACPALSVTPCATAARCLRDPERWGDRCACGKTNSCSLETSRPRLVRYAACLVLFQGHVKLRWGYGRGAAKGQ